MSTVTIERVLDAPPATVWNAFTDASRLALWMWPPRFATSAVSVPESGGAFRLASVEVGMGVTGTYLDVSAPNRFSLGWRWDDDAHESRVTVILSPCEPGRTRLELMHSGNRDDAEAADHRDGWTACLGRLAEHVRNDRG